MAKLPGINYNAAVPSMGRESPYGPIQIANAEAQALYNFGVAADNIADAYVSIKEQEGMNQAAEAASLFAQREAEIRTNPNIEERGELMEMARRDVGDEFKPENVYAANAFRDKFEPWSNNRKTAVITDGVMERYQIEREKTAQNGQTLAEEGELEAAISLYEQSPIFSEEDKSALISAARNSYEIGVVSRTSIEGTPDEIDSLLKVYKDEDYSGSFTPQQRSAAITQLEQAFKESMTDFVAGAAREGGVVLGDLAVDVAAGRAGPMQIEEVFNQRDAAGNFIMSPAKRESLLKEAERVSRQGMERQSNVALVFHAMNSDTVLDPGNADHRTAVNDYWDVLMQDGTLTPLQQAAHAAEMADKVGILPDPVLGMFRSTAFRGSADQVEYAATIWGNIDAVAPQTLTNVSPETAALFDTVTGMNLSGAELEDAINLVRTNISKPEHIKSQLRQDYGQNYPNTEVYRIFSSMLDGDSEFDTALTWGAPDVNSAAFASYALMEKEMYAYIVGDQGGTIAEARRAAFAMWKRVFGVTEINGRRDVSMFPAEKEYSYLDPDELSDDLTHFYNTNDIDPSKATIVPDVGTARDKPGNRSYAVYVEDEYGMPSLHDERWLPDFERIQLIRDTQTKAEHEETKRYQQIREDEGQVSYHGTRFVDSFDSTGEALRRLPGQIWGPIKRSFTPDEIERQRELEEMDLENYGRKREESQ